MPPRDSKLKLGDKELPIPRWALNALWVALIISMAGYGAWWIAEKTAGSRSAVSPAEKIQMDLASSHFGMEPTREFIAYSDDRGELKVLEFSDGVASMIRRIRNGPVQVAWLTLPSADTSFPVAALSIDVGFAAAAYAQQAYCNAPFPHPGQVGAPIDRRINGCVIERIWTFSDGCQVGQYYDSCNNIWQTYPSGHPVLRWWVCNHY